MPEEESLEVTSKNRHRTCIRDMLGQTVPSKWVTATGKAGQPRMTDIQEDL